MLSVVGGGMGACSVSSVSASDTCAEQPINAVNPSKKAARSAFSAVLFLLFIFIITRFLSARTFFWIAFVPCSALATTYTIITDGSAVFKGMRNLHIIGVNIRKKRRQYVEIRGKSPRFVYFIC